MTKVNCDIVNDLLPLYAEDIVSDASKNMIEEHIRDCPVCLNRLKEMKKEVNIPLENNMKPMLLLKKKMDRKKRTNILLSVLITAIIFILGFINIMAPIPIPYDDNIINFTEQEDGALLVTISGEVAGYDFHGYLEESISGRSEGDYVYHITFWDSLWHKYIGNKSIQSFIINSNSQGGYHKVAAIYYYTGETVNNNEEHKDILIYGNDLYKTGGIVTLPRLVLSAYFKLALIIILFGLMITIIVRKNDMLRKIVTRITLLPISFNISLLCVKGYNFTSHYLLKDLSGIILLMIPVYCLLLLVDTKISKKVTV